MRPACRADGRAVRRGRRAGGRLGGTRRDVDALLALAGEHGVPAFRAGRVGSAGRRAGTAGWGAGVFTWAIGALRQTYFEAIPRRMQHPDVDRSAGE